VGKVISLLFPPSSNQTLVHGGEGFEQQFVGGGLMCKGLNEIPPQEFVTQIISKIVSQGEKRYSIEKSLKINP